ncbi:MAG TPA: haloacid dehalogenase [Chloroflexota bacterium]|nr:haloacid dehalogenase [Chloroflexota bacterium]
MSILDEIERWARSEFETRNAAREQALSQSRELTRTCANTIRAVHRRDYEQARALLDRAKVLSDGLSENLRPYPDLFYTGYVQDAQKEYVEANATFSLVSGSPMPSPQEIGVAAAPFLNGLAETVGELRRFVLDKLRRGELDGSETLLQTMDDIYSLLVTIDYPDALTGGLRRTTDLARGILERTRGDLTFALRQQELETSLTRVEQQIQRTLRGTAGTEDGGGPA